MTTPARSIRRRAAAALGAAAILGVLAVPAALELRLEADLAALLPDGDRAAADYRVFARDFAGLKKVYLLVRARHGAAPPEPAELVSGARALAEALAASPEVARARWGLEPADREFFERWMGPRTPLLLGADWRAAVERRIEPAAVAARAARIHADLLSPLGVGLARRAVADPFGWSEELLAEAAGVAGVSVDPATRGFLAPDGAAALVVVTPAASEIDPESGRRLAAEIDRAVEAMRSAAGADLTAVAAGGPLYAAADEAIVRRDLVRTVGVSAAACGALLGLAFEGVVLPALVVGALPLALLWTAAALGLAVGSLSAVALGFAAVLVGLGVDYAIHGVTRWRQEAARTGEGALALAAAYRGAGPGILASAVTTAAAFAVLALSRFRPLREVGGAVAVGIVCMLGAAAAAGCLLAWRRPRRPGRERWLWGALGRWVTALAAFGRRRRRMVLVATVVASAVAAVGASRLAIDSRLDVLRPGNHPVLAAERELTERFGVALDTTAVLVSAATLDEALERAGAAESAVRRTSAVELQVASPGAWLVAAERRGARLAELEKLPLGSATEAMERALREAGLDPRAFAPGLETVRRLGRGEDPGNPPPEAWPDWLAELVRFAPDGVTVALYLRLPEGAWAEGPPPEVIAAIDRAAPGSAVASTPALGRAMRRLAAGDLGTLGLAALALVALIVALSFRGRPRPAALALVPVVLGTLWTLGGWALAGRQLDLVSLMVLPVLLGIGIDDGLHVVHARHREPAGGMLGALDHTGRAIALTTLTTCAGFGSLTLSSLPGLAAAGALLAIGVVACLVATVVVLPALDGGTR